MRNNSKKKILSALSAEKKISFFALLSRQLFASLAISFVALGTFLSLSFYLNNSPQSLKEKVLPLSQRGTEGDFPKKQTESSSPHLQVLGETNPPQPSLTLREGEFSPLGTRGPAQLAGRAGGLELKSLLTSLLQREGALFLSSCHNCIQGKHIQNSAIDSSEIENKSILSSDIKTGQINSRLIKDFSIQTDDLTQSLQDTINQEETDPIFSSWDKSSGISIAESQISDLQNYLTTISGLNISLLTNDSGYITDGNTSWDNSYSFITASSTDTLTNKSGNISMWTNNAGYLTGYTETDPVFLAWDKSTDISIAESQISDLQSYLTDLSTLTTDNLAQGTTNLYSQWTTGGTTISYLNNVGIGTTTPTAKLDVRGTAFFGTTSGDFNIEELTAEQAGLDFALTNGQGLTQQRIRFLDGTSGLGKIVFDFSNDAFSTSSRAMVIQQNGNLGIGTTTPQNKFHLYTGDGTSGLRTSLICSNSTTSKLYTDASGNLICGVDQTGSGTGNIVDTLAATLGAGNDADGTGMINLGNVGIGTSNPAGALDVLSTTLLGNLRFVEDTSVNYIQSGNSSRTTSSWQPLHFGKYASTDTYLAINSTGNVGIGTTTPTTKFSVLGNSFFDGNLSVSGSTTLNNTLSGILRADNGVVSKDEKTTALVTYWDNITSSARLFGGEITDNGDGTVAIAAGGGIVKEDEVGPETIPTSLNQGQASELDYISWSGVASLTLTDNAYNFIYYDKDTNSILATTDFYSISFTEDFTIGRAYRQGTDVVVRLCGTNAWNFNRRVQLFGEEYFSVVRTTGLMISETGTRNIALTGGILWAELVNRFSVDPFDSSASDVFKYWYRDGSGGWSSTGGQSQIDNVRYDNNSGTLATLVANRYGVHWVYVLHDSTVHVVYGRGNYTLTEAENATTPTYLPGLLSSYATLVGKIIVKKDATSFTETLSPFTQIFQPTIAYEHNELSGLQGGEASNYFHLNSNEYTTRWQSNGTDIWNNTSNIGIGTTAPDSKLSVRGTATQLKLAYDDSNYQTLTVGSNGNLSIARNGAAATLALTDVGVGIGTTSPGNKFSVWGDTTLVNVSSNASSATSVNAGGVSLSVLRDGATSMYGGFSSSESQWSLGYVFPVNTTISKISWYNIATTERNRHYYLEYSLDGSTNWTKIPITGWFSNSTQSSTDEAEASNSDGWNTVTFAPIAAKGFRITIISFWSVGDANAGISEIQMYTSSPGTAFEVTSSGNIGIGTTTPSYTLHVSGSAYSTGGWSSSDERWKNNITTLGDNTLDKLLSLNPVSYTWDLTNYPNQGFGEGQQLGFIAQQVEPIFPQLVNTDSTGYKSLSYEKLTPILTKAIQQLNLKKADLSLLTTNQTAIDQNFVLLGNRITDLEEWIPAFAGIVEVT